MKDVPTIDSPDHEQTKLTIIEADVDVGIVPLVNWLNSFHSIMTRWSCEGGQSNCPYITIWVYGDQHDGGVSRDELKQIREKLNHPSVHIDAICTQGEIHVYNIAFKSKKQMKHIQKAITGKS